MPRSDSSVRVADIITAFICVNAWKILPRAGEPGEKNGAWKSEPTRVFVILKIRPSKVSQYYVQ